MDGLPFCSCIFFLSYMLPCRHISHLYQAEGILTGEVWERFIDNFGPSGMEIYEDRRPRERRRSLLEMPASGNDSGRINHVLGMCEVSDQIRSTFYMLEDTSTDNSHGFLNEVEQRIPELTSTFYQHNQPQPCPLASYFSSPPILSSSHTTISVPSSEDIYLPRPFLSVPAITGPTPSTAPSSYYSGSDLNEEYTSSLIPEL